MDLAWALVTTSSSREIFPDSRASKIRIRVMIFVMLAGLLCSSAPFSQITCPVEASMRMALGADISGPSLTSWAAVSRAFSSPAALTASEEATIPSPYPPSFKSGSDPKAGNVPYRNTANAVTNANNRLIRSPVSALYYQYICLLPKNVRKKVFPFYDNQLHLCYTEEAHTFYWRACDL